ncbi:unnamed protein product, partial [Symbiodinium sp. CCMP2456]
MARTFRREALDSLFAMQISSTSSNALADLGPGAASQVAAFVACGGSDSLDA